MENFRETYPIGTGVTELLWSDSHPFEVIGYAGETTLIIRSMTAERDPNWKPEIIPGGFVGHCANNHSQEWVLKSDLDGRVLKIRRSKSKKHKNPEDALSKYWYKGDRRFSVGKATYFYDYNF